MKTQGVTDDLARLAAQPLAAMQVLRLVEDSRVSTADLARVIEADPALSARVLRLANSPYYGLSRRVGSASRAVVLLGFSAVRALAVSAAFGLMAEDAELGPPDFWSHSVLTAIGASVAARAVGTAVGDAFSTGLLHDLGMVIVPEHGGADLDHSTAGASVLEHWHFPASVVRAVATHHRPIELVEDTLGRLVMAGEALAVTIDDHAPDEERPPPLEQALDALSLSQLRAPAMLAETQREANRLAKFLGSGA